MRRLRTGWVFLVLIAMAALLPWVLQDSYFRNVMVLCGLYALFAVGLDFLMGYVGVYSFGHAAFFGAGAYAAGILVAQFGWSYWGALPLAMTLSFALGILVSLPALRMRGVYFAIATLAAAEILRLVVVNWPSVTRGVMGLSVPTPNLAWFGDNSDPTLVFHYLIYGLLALSCFLIDRFVKSPAGRAFIAVRENEPLAGAIGVPVFRIKAAAFGVSAMLAGLAGALYAPFVGILTPELLGVNYSALALLMVVVGGKGTLLGPILGAFMFSVVTEVFRVANELRMVVFALLLIVSIILMPKGVAVPLARLFERVTGRGR